MTTYQLTGAGMSARPAKAVAIGAVALSLLALGGCATKKYVNEQVGVVDAKVAATNTQLAATQSQVSANQQQLAAHEAKLGQIDATAREALERAMAAGKLAEGKFVYSMVMSDETTKFPVSRSALSKEEEAALTAFAEKLKSENKNVYVEIQGHTDSTGSNVGNMRLGEARAEAVRRFLNGQGVPLNRMSTISYGEEKPAATNRTRAGRAQNRRVVLVVLS